jgi:hypothetical protein
VISVLWAATNEGEHAPSNSNAVENFISKCCFVCVEGWSIGSLLRTVDSLNNNNPRGMKVDFIAKRWRRSKSGFLWLAFSHVYVYKIEGRWSMLYVRYIETHRIAFMCTLRQIIRFYERDSPTNFMLSVTQHTQLRAFRYKIC